MTPPPWPRFAWLLGVSPCLVFGGCVRDGQVSPMPEESAPVTPTPGPYLGKSTWGGGYVDYWSVPVHANTTLFINVETQHDGHLEVLIYHLWGTLTIDGMDVPTNKGQWMYGTYVSPGIIDLSGEFYGYLLDMHIEYQYEGPCMIFTMNLNEDYYEYTSFFAEVDYIPFDY